MTAGSSKMKLKQRACISGLTCAAKIFLALLKKAVIPGAVLAVSLGSLSNAEPGPSMEIFLNTDNDSGNWILPGRNYSGNRQVWEGEIGPYNVGQLKLAWTFKLPGADPVEAAPIVWDGIVYVTSGQDDVFALDATTGNLKWQFRPNAQQRVGFPRNRGVAVYEGMVFIGMIDGHLAALDAKTGKEIWNKQTVDDPQTGYYSMAPVPYKGKILIGESNGDWGGIGNVRAFDSKTGERLWQWQSIPRPGEPGNETWSGDSWKRGGGAVWNGMAIDPDSDTLYLTLGNPSPDLLAKVRQGRNLYTDSMVALDISGATPKLKWYHQFIASDAHDYDPAMPPVLFTGNVDGKPLKLAATGDKAGNFWILNAETGDLISKTPLSFQFNQDQPPQIDGANYACPSWNGGVEFNGGAYDPATNTFFVPSSNQCAQWSANEQAEFVPGQFYLGGSEPVTVGPNSGWFSAINVATGVFNWRNHLNLPANGGALVMDYQAPHPEGNASIVFTGLLDGRFAAFDGKSGSMLWHYDTGAVIWAPPATFVAKGQRYVLIASGGAGSMNLPEMKANIGPNILTVFVSPNHERTTE
jgi:alcohol dehydrogenase (cytochrome c)